MEIIARQVANSGDDIEDLGRVSEALIKTMRLPEGQFVPINGLQHVA